jgi:hypothetical protein
MGTAKKWHGTGEKGRAKIPCLISFNNLLIFRSIGGVMENIDLALILRKIDALSGDLEDIKMRLSRIERRAEKISRKVKKMAIDASSIRRHAKKVTTKAETIAKILKN